MIDNYSKCSVTWEQPSSPLVTDLERDTDGYGDQTDDLSSTKSDGSYNTNENPDMSVDINADENERRVAGPGYVILMRNLLTLKLMVMLIQMRSKLLQIQDM